MTRYTQIKIGLAVVGVLVWAYGYRANDPTTRLIGIIFLALAVILRLLPKRLRDEDYPKS
jgi:hypothetical protein